MTGANRVTRGTTASNGDKIATESKEAAAFFSLVPTHLQDEAKAERARLEEKGAAH
jgi:hypothetical protein